MIAHDSKALGAPARGTSRRGAPSATPSSSPGATGTRDTGEARALRAC
jgi:hypothetical protein